MSAGGGVAGATGAVYCWGTARDGELGVSTDKEHCVPFPTKVRSLASDVVQIAMGDRFTVCRKADGTVWSWGSCGKGRSLGRAGDGGVDPGRVDLPTPCHMIAVGQSHSLAVVGEDRRVFAWGNPLFGALGNPANAGSRPEPVLCGAGGGNSGAPLGLLVGVASIAAGYQNSAAILTDGTLVGWGNNDFGKTGCLSSADTPLREVVLRGVRENTVPLPGPARAVALGSLYSACILQDGTLLTWGYGRAGNLGHGDRRSRSTPTVVEALQHLPVVDVACTVGQINPNTSAKTVQGQEQPHTLACTADGSAYSWGSCHKGMLGNHSRKILSPTGGDELVPYRIGDPTRDDATAGYLKGKSVIRVVSSSIHSGLVTTDGDVIAMGCGSGGRMGVLRYMQGLHGGRSRMKCYVSQPTVVEAFAQEGLQVASLVTTRAAMAAIVVGKSAPRPVTAVSTKPHSEEEDVDGSDVETGEALADSTS